VEVALKAIIAVVLLVAVMARTADMVLVIGGQAAVITKAAADTAAAPTGEAPAMETTDTGLISWVIELNLSDPAWIMLRRESCFHHNMQPSCRDTDLLE
jgi:hypothetical protein